MFIDDMSRGSDRLFQLYHATRVVTDEAFLLTDKDPAGDANVFQLPVSDLREPLLSPLYVLPFFQIIAYRATTDLGRWEGYPLTKAYREAAPSKTTAIDRVMLPPTSAQWARFAGLCARPGRPRLGWTPTT